MIKVNEFKALSWSIALVNPALGLISFLTTLGRKEAYPAFCFSLALIYVYFPLPWDSRNTFYRIFLYPEEGVNLYASLSLYFNKYLGIEYITVIFIYTFMMFVLWSKIFFYISYPKKTTLISVSIFVLYLSFFEYRQVMDLQRISLAFTLFLFATLVIRTKWLTVFVLVLSSFIHYLLILFLLFYLIKDSKLIHKNLLLILGISVCFGIVGELILFNNLQLLSAYIPDGVYIYLSVMESKFSSNTSRYIVYFVRILFMVISLIIFKAHLREDNGNAGLLSLYFLSSSFCFALIFNEVFFERLHIFLTMLAVVIAIRIQISQRRLIALTLTVLLNFSMNSISNYSIFFSDRYENIIHDSPKKMEMAYKPFYLPTFYLLCFGDSGYSNEFIYSVTK